MKRRCVWNITFLLCSNVWKKNVSKHQIPSKELCNFNFKHVVSDGGVCRCGPVGGDSGQSVSHRDQWISHGNVSGFTVQHNDYFIGW